MKRQSITLAGLGLVVAVGTTPMSARQALTVEQTVDAFHRALANGDSGTALGLLSPEVVVVESGNVQTLTEYRSGHLGADMAFAQAVPRERSGITVRTQGNVAWAWSTGVTRGTYREREVNSRSAELMVLARTDRGWRIEAIHWSSRSLRQ